MKKIKINDLSCSEYSLPKIAQELFDADRAKLRDAIRATSGRTVSEDLQSVRRRPIDAPMATKNEDSPYIEDMMLLGLSIVGGFLIGLMAGMVIVICGN